MKLIVQNSGPSIGRCLQDIFKKDLVNLQKYTYVGDSFLIRLPVNFDKILWATFL